MTQHDSFDQLVEVMLNEDDDALQEYILMEDEKDQVLAGIGGDVTLMNYLLMFEEFLEQHDVYLFDGWDTAQIAHQPKIEKFWAIFYLIVDDKVDLRGAKRVRDAMKQGSVKAKRLEDGKVLLIFQILKRELDYIENSNKEKIEKLSSEALEEL